RARTPPGWAATPSARSAPTVPDGSTSFRAPPRTRSSAPALKRAAKTSAFGSRFGPRAVRGGRPDGIARDHRYAGRMARPAHFEGTAVRVDKLVVGPFENNVFVIRCKNTGEAAIVDAANEHELLLEVARATGVRRVLTTHGHWDHIQAVTAMR